MTVKKIMGAALISCLVAGCSPEALNVLPRMDQSQSILSSSENEDFFGSSASESYQFSGRFGKDHLYERGGFDRILFPDLNRKEVKIYAEGDDLVIDAPLGDRVRVIDFGRGKSYQIEWIAFKDKKRLELPALARLFGISETEFERYVVGNRRDAYGQPLPGTVIMGGSTDVDEAMRWMMARADGGDFVVVRASGSPAYNEYIYHELLSTDPTTPLIDSCETLIIDSYSKANNPEILDIVRQAEALFIAGGDQYDYVEKWQGSALVDLINERVRWDGVPIGGTSSGANVMGAVYFSAENNAITSQEALDDPFHLKLTLRDRDLFRFPFLEHVIADPHFNNPDRMGRMIGFLANGIITDKIDWQEALGIGVDQRTALAIDEDGEARVFSYGTGFQEWGYTYLIRPKLSPPRQSRREPLHWSASSEALEVLKVAGTPDGSNRIALKSFESDDGNYFELSVIDGRLTKDLVRDWIKVEQP